MCILNHFEAAKLHVISHMTLRYYLKVTKNIILCPFPKEAVKHSG